METIFYIYVGVFLLIYFIYKYILKSVNPFKKIWFWIIQTIFAILITTLFVYVLLRAIGGPPDLHELTEKEKRQVDLLKKKYNCEVRVEKDWEVVIDNKTGGTLYLQLDFNQSKVNFCLSDSSNLLKEAAIISQNLQSVMEKKNMYNDVSISFYSSDLSVKGAETPTCEKTYVFSIPNNKFIEFRTLGKSPVIIQLK